MVAVNSFFLDLIFPKTCYCCHRNGVYFCPSCLATLNRRGVDPLLGHPHLDGCLSLFRYQRHIRQAIRHLKYNFVSDLAPSFGEIISQELITSYPNLLHYWQENSFTLIPIPLHSFRQNWRGFNQSSLIVELLSPLINLSFSDSVLTRTVNTVSQTKLAVKSQRLSNVTAAFQIGAGFQPQSNYLLFDDVTTTHSTLSAAAAVLATSGASSIWGLTLAG